MSKTKVAINGFGRIGRLAFRQLILNQEVEVVAVNDLTDVKTLAHLLKYDSSQGQFGRGVTSREGILDVENYPDIKVFAERNPENLPWAELGVEVVLESTGIFRDREGASKHLTAGAHRVVISAPAKGDITTVVLGVKKAFVRLRDEDVSKIQLVCLSIFNHRGWISRIHHRKLCFVGISDSPDVIVLESR